MQAGLGQVWAEGTSMLGAKSTQFNQLKRGKTPKNYNPILHNPIVTVDSEKGKKNSSKA